MNPGVPLKATTRMVCTGHSISHSLPIAPASFGPSEAKQVAFSIAGKCRPGCVNGQRRFLDRNSPMLKECRGSVWTVLQASRQWKLVRWHWHGPIWPGDNLLAFADFGSMPSAAAPTAAKPIGCGSKPFWDHILGVGAPPSLEPI